MKLLRMGRGVTLGLCIYQFALGGCVPISERMDTLEATEQQEALIREGQVWLEQASAADLASAEGRRVFLRVAKARFQLAKQSRTFEALRTFRGSIRPWSKSMTSSRKRRARRRPCTLTSAHDLWMRSWPTNVFWNSIRTQRRPKKVRRLEREAAFRDAKALSEISAFERFLETYGHTSNERDPLSQEAYALLATKVFVDETMVEDTVEAHRSFQQRFPESKEYAQSRTREVKLAVDNVRGEHDLALLRAFRARYSERQGAEDAVRQVYQWEAQCALDAAIDARTASAFDAFRSAYPQAEWNARADMAQMEVEFNPLRVAILNARAVPSFLMDTFLKRYRHHPHLNQLLMPLKDTLAMRVEGTEELWAVRLYLAAFPDTPQRAQFTDLERRLALRSVDSTTDPKSWLDFLYWAPSDERADDVESKYYAAMGGAHGSLWAWRTELTEPTRVRGRTWTVDMTVQDCHGRQSMDSLGRN